MIPRGVVPKNNILPERRFGQKFCILFHVKQRKDFCNGLYA